MSTKVFYWEKKWKDKICGITKSRLRPGKNKYGLSYSVFLDCSHGFYRSVLNEWVKNCPLEYPTCPLCRKVFKYEICYHML
jgi:hypothetical protein